jgi:hypothetical protein
MAEERKPRDQESRIKTARKSDSWVRPSELPMPDPVDGWKFRYIRTASLGVADTRNVSKRFREGWEAVKATDYPELDIMNELDSRWPDGVEVGGLLLCKIPVEITDQRDTHHRELNQRTLESVDQGFMNEHDPRMPKYNDSKSRTQFRKG